MRRIPRENLLFPGTTAEAGVGLSATVEGAGVGNETAVLTGEGKETVVLSGEGEVTVVVSGEGEDTAVLSGVSDVGVDDVEPEVAVTPPGVAVSTEPTESDFGAVAVGITGVAAGDRDG